MKKQAIEKTSWEKVSGWYAKLVGDKGHYFHRQIILPNLARIMLLKEGETVAEIGCGEGVLGRTVVAKNGYLGIDIAKDLILEAKKKDDLNNHKYLVADATVDLNIAEKFDWVVMMLSLQNINKPFRAITNAKKLLAENGKLVIVLNHPCFRIPKHSDWEDDRDRGKIWRKVDKYLNPMEIPIESNPFKGTVKKTTYSYHYPISGYSQMLADNGLLIERIEEWVSNKKSQGVMAVAEDKARREIPMFMTIICRLAN